jgi:hypothetical protein
MKLGPSIMSLRIRNNAMEAHIFSSCQKTYTSSFNSESNVNDFLGFQILEQQ